MTRKEPKKICLDASYHSSLNWHEILAEVHDEEPLWYLDFGVTGDDLLDLPAGQRKGLQLAVDHFYEKVVQHHKGALLAYQGAPFRHLSDTAQCYTEILSPLFSEMPVILHFEMGKTITPSRQCEIYLHHQLIDYQVELSHAFFGDPEAANQAIVVFDIEEQQSFIREKIKISPNLRLLHPERITPRWHGLETIYVERSRADRDCERQLQGFEAAGGKVIDFSNK